MTSSEKPPEQVSTAQQPEQSSKTLVYRNLSLAEAREPGIPVRNDLIVSPVPRGLAGTRSESEHR
jgi:hypothetical protein